MSQPNTTDPPSRLWLPIADEPEPDGWPEDVAFLRHCSASLNTSLTECAADEQVTAGVSDEAIACYLESLCQGFDAHEIEHSSHSAPLQCPSAKKAEIQESDGLLRQNPY